MKQYSSKTVVLRYAGIGLLIGAVIATLFVVLTGCGGDVSIGSIVIGDPGGSAGASGHDAGGAAGASSDVGSGDAAAPDAPARSDAGSDAGDALLVVRRVDPVVPRYEPLGRRAVFLAEYGLLNRGASPMRIRTLRVSMSVQESATALEALYLMYRPNLDSKVGRASASLPLVAQGSPFPRYDLETFKACDPVVGKECTEIFSGQEAFFTVAADAALSDPGVEAAPKTFRPLLGDCVRNTCSVTAENADGAVPAYRILVVPNGVATGILGDPMHIVPSRLSAAKANDAPAGSTLGAQQSVVAKFVLTSRNVGDANATFSLRAIGLDIGSSNMGALVGAQVYRTSVDAANLMGAEVGAPATVNSGASVWMGYWVTTPTFASGTELSPGISETFIVTMKTNGMQAGDTLTVGIHSVDWTTTSSWVWTDVCGGTPIPGNTLVF